MAAKANNANILAQIQNRVKVGKDLKNAFGNYKYRNVESIYEAVKPILAEFDCSLVVTDEIIIIGDRYYIKATATISDSGGSVIGSACAYAREAAEKKGMDACQLTGSTSSYARKYALGGLLLLDDSKDIDSLDNSNHSNQSNHHSASTSKSDELTATKRKVADTLKSLGVNDFAAFFSFVGVDKDDLGSLKNLLSSDMVGAVSAFNLKKGK